MKNIFFSIVVLAFFPMQIIAQGNLPGGFKHIIEVGRYSDYGKGYLTITDVNGVGITKNGVSKMNYYTYEYIDEYKETKGNHLYKGELILEVDGVSAAGWTKEQFYSKVDNRHDIITLKIRLKMTRESSTIVKRKYVHCMNYLIVLNNLGMFLQH